MSGRGRIYKREPNGPWWVDYYSAGRRVRQSAGYDKAKAQKMLRKHIAREQLREKGARGQASNAVGLDAVRDAWLESVALTCRASTGLYYRNAINAILSRLPCRTVLQLSAALVTRDSLARLRGNPDRKDAVGARTINSQVGALKTMLKWAEEARLIDSNPLARLKPLAPTRKRYRRALTEAEARLLIEKSPTCYSRIWQFMLGTGFRREEVQGLTWSDIDLDRAEAYLPEERQKNRTAATQPLPQTVVEMLRAHQAETGRSGNEPVFANAEGKRWTVNLLRKLRSCLRQVGKPGFPKATRKEVTAYWTGVDLHALRVTYITHLVRAGVDIKTVQRLARHKTIAMTLDVYARTFPEDQRTAVEKLPYFGHTTGTLAQSSDRNLDVG